MVERTTEPAYDWFPQIEAWETSVPLSSANQSQAGASFSADDVINAYNKGKTEYHQEVDAIRRRVLHENATRAAEMAIKVLEFLTEETHRAYRVYLRTDLWFSFEMLVVVNEDSFIKDEFDRVYDLVSAMELEERSETFYPSFGFLAVTESWAESINQQALNSDGYIYHLNNQSQA